MKAEKSKHRDLHTSREKVFAHWRKRHNERDDEKLLRLAKRGLYNFTWAATVNTFVEQGHLSDGKKVLDVGFGWGRTIVGLKQMFPDLEVVGIEIDEKALSNTQIILGKYLDNDSKIRLQLGDAENLGYKDNSFDAVLSTRVFQYLTHPQKSVDQIYRILGTEGRVVIMVPNKLNPFRYFWYHTHLISAFTLTKWLKKAGFRNIKHGSIVFFSDRWYLFSSNSIWVKVERLIAKIPGVNKFGGNVWVSGEKK